MSGRDLVSEMREGRDPPLGPVSRGGVFDLILTIVVVAAIGSAGYFGVTYWLSANAPQPAPPPASTVASASTADAWTDADAALCKSRARAAANAPLPVEFALANPAVTEGFAGHATMMHCILSTKTARFCDPAQKSALVEMVNDYLGKVDTVQLGLGLQGAPMALMGGLFGGEMAGGSGVYDEVRTETLGFMEGYHKQLSADLQALARAGIVGASDFSGMLGLGVPKAIQTVFGGVEAQKHLCG